MSKANKQVLIVSLYDRGFYLSNELAEQGHAVTLVNLPYKMSEPSFWSNPFGFFKNKKLTYNQKYYLEGPGTEVLKTGLSLWLKNGPVDFKSKFSQRALQARKNSKEWLKPFSQSLFSTVNHLDKYMDVNEKSKSLMALYGDYAIKNSTSKTSEYEYKNSQRLGVKTINADIKNIDFKSKSIISVDINDETLEFSKVICLLSSYECNFLNKKLLNYVYDNKAITPEWVWLKSKFKFEANEGLSTWPQNFVALEDVNDTWAYKNLLFVRKNAESSELEVHFRWPYNERKNIKYINEELKEIKTFFESKIKNIKLTIIPVVVEELSPFYIYNAEHLELYKQQLKKNKNTIPLGPEIWPSWDLLKVMQLQYSLAGGEALKL